MRLSFALPLLAIAPAAMSQDLSSIYASVTKSLDINLSSVTQFASSYLSAHSDDINSVLSSFSANPGALSSASASLQSLASQIGTTLPAFPTTTSGTSAGDGSGDASGDGGNAAVSNGPSSSLVLMGAAAAGVFGLAVAL